MKKVWLLLVVPGLAIAAYLVRQNLPSKRYARHVIKARMFAEEENLMAARLEYEAAYNATGAFTPYASLEVLRLTNRMNIKDGNHREALKNTRLFVQTYPGNKEGRVLLAQMAFQSGDTELGFGTLNGLLETDPWHYPARLLLTSVRINQGRFDLAEEQLRNLYERYPDSVQGLLPLAEVLIRQGRGAESRGYLGKVLAKDPLLTKARILLTDSWLQDRMLDSAAAALEAWKLAVPGEELAIQVRKARLFSLYNRLEEARSALSDYTIPIAENLPALSELAILEVKAGNYDSAIAIYKSMGEISGSARAGADNLVFYLELKNRNPARALETLKTLQLADKRPGLLIPIIAAYLAIGQDNKADELIQRQPDSLRANLVALRTGLLPDMDFIGQWGLINYYQLNGQHYWVLESIRELYRKWPRSPLAITLLAGEYASLGSTAKAAEALATLEKPDSSQQLLLANLLAQSGRTEPSRKLAEKLAADHPRLPGINLLLANLWMQKDPARASAYYEAELAVSPGHIVALNNLAWEYGINKKDLVKARPYLEKLQRTKNLDPRILDTIGWILAVNGDLKEGERYARNALNLVPDFPAFQYHLAYILFKSGRSAEGRKHLEAALASKRPFEERKEAETLQASAG